MGRPVTHKNEDVDRKDRMKPIINHLVQLQELIEARAQQEASLENAQLSQLNEAIQTLTKGLPETISLQFARLQKKGFVGIVPIANGVCTGCGMAIPVSLAHAVRAAEQIYACPNCARLLYSPATALPRRTAAPARRFTEQKVGISRFSSPTLMIPNSAAKTRDELLEEICTKLDAEGFVDDGKKLYVESLRREAIVSTAVDHGLAFPHVRGVEGGGLTLALATSKKGIKFGSPDKKLTRLVFFVVIPTAASAFYLTLLSGLTATFRNKAHSEKILEAETPQQMWKLLSSATRTTIR